MFQFCPFCRGEAPWPDRYEMRSVCPCGRFVADCREDLGEVSVVLVGTGHAARSPTARFTVSHVGYRELVLGYDSRFILIRESDRNAIGEDLLEEAMTHLEVAPVMDS